MGLLSRITAVEVHQADNLLDECDLTNGQERAAGSYGPYPSTASSTFVLARRSKPCEWCLATACEGELAGASSTREIGQDALSLTFGAERSQWRIWVSDEIVFGFSNEWRTDESCAG